MGDSTWHHKEYAELPVMWPMRSINFSPLQTSLGASSGLGGRYKLFGFLLDSCPKDLVDTSEEIVRAFSGRLFRGAQMSGDIVDKVVLLPRSSAQYLPQAIWLNKILVGHGDLLRYCSPSPFLVLLARLHGLEGH